MMPTIANYLNKLVELKSQLADNLVSKGVTAEQSEKFNTLISKVLDISGGLGKIVLWDGENHSDYENDVYVQYTGHQGANSVSVAEFKSSQPDFCSENTSYALHYSSSIFGWNTVIITSNKTPVSISHDTLIAINYNSDASEDGELRLVNADGVDSIETVLEKAQSEGEYTIISWHWVYANDFVTMCAPCYDITPGDYYVVWVTKSNNTNVRVRRAVIIS